MTKSVERATDALRSYYKNRHPRDDAACFMAEANLIANLAVAKAMAKLMQPRMSDDTVSIDACGHTTPEAVEQAAREAVERAAPNILNNDFKAELSKSLDQLRDAAFELLVALKDRQDAKRWAKS